jgi:hypothetical protein
LHPAVAAADPLVLEWQRGGRTLTCRLHAWKPVGGAYAGLPADEAEALERRSERVIVSESNASELRASQASELLLDLRRQH